MTIRHYAHTLYAGFIVSDESEEIVLRRDPYSHKLSKNAFGFRFFDRELMKGKIGELLGDKHNFSPWYFYGVEKSQSDVLLEYGAGTTLYRNMINNDYKRIVDTEFGQSIPMEDEDVCLGDINPEQ